jgi:hypothetical protein
MYFFQNSNVAWQSAPSGKSPMWPKFRRIGTTIHCITKRPTTQAIADSIIRGQHLNHVNAVIFSMTSEI